MFSLRQLKVFQSDIFLKRSKINGCFFKHLDIFLSAQTEEVYEEAYLKSNEKGLPTLKQRLIELHLTGKWTEDDITKLEESKSYCSNLRTTMAKMHLKSEREIIKYQIKQAEDKIREEEQKRDELIGLTAESFALRKTNLFLLFLSLHKDEECETRLFKWEDFDDLDDTDLSNHFKDFNDILARFSQENLKKIALLPSYLNPFFLSQDNPYIFYGEPICKLSFYQTEVFSNARYYKKIIEESNNNIPEDVINDPEKLIEWFQINKNAQKLMEKYENQDNMNMSFVGATKEDLEVLGGAQGKKINLAQEAMKRGGALTMEDMIKLNGL